VERTGTSVLTSVRHKDRHTKRVSYTARLGGHDGIAATAETNTDAREAVLATAAAIVRDYQPTIICYRNYTIIVFRAGDGWAYTYTNADHGKVGPERRDFCVHGYDSRAAAEKAARGHVGNNILDARTQGVDTVFDLVTDEWDRHELQRSARWQRAYRHAELLGERNPHEWASLHRANDGYATVEGYQAMVAHIVA